MLKPILGIVLISLIVISTLYEASGVFDLPIYLPEVNNCNIITHEVGPRNVVLRIDDIQAYADKGIQIKMLDELVRRNMTASLAVIPLNLSQDREMYNYLIRNKCNFDIALHGYNSDEMEFQYINYSDAQEKIIMGMNEIKRINSNVTTFIPPNNEISEEGKQAVWDNGMKVISSGFWNSGEYGFSISPYDWGEKNLLNVSYVLEDCEADLQNTGYCVIMFHPQDYATNNKFDEEKYGLFLELLDSIEKQNVTVSNLRDLYYSKQK